MPEARFQRPAQARLVRIQLPGMHITDHRQPLAPSSLDACFGVPIRQDAQISAASNREIRANVPTKSSHGKFNDFSKRRLYAKRAARRAGNAIHIMFHRENAGIVEESKFG